LIFSFPSPRFGVAVTPFWDLCTASHKHLYGRGKTSWKRY
jgi:hypothetical protein